MGGGPRVHPAPHSHAFYACVLRFHSTLAFYAFALRLHSVLRSTFCAPRSTLFTCGTATRGTVAEARSPRQSTAVSRTGRAPTASAETRVRSRECSFHGRTRWTSPWTRGGFPHDTAVFWKTLLRRPNLGRQATRSELRALCSTRSVLHALYASRSTHSTLHARYAPRALRSTRSTPHALHGNRVDLRSIRNWFEINLRLIRDRFEIDLRSI